MLTRFKFCLIMLMIFGIPGTELLSAPRSHILILESHIQKVNQREPWQFDNSSDTANLAIYIGNDKFLTSYRSVDYAKSITGQKRGDFQKFRFEMIAGQKELNLALVRAKKDQIETSEYKKWIKGFKPVSFKEEIAIGSRVTIRKLGQNLTVKSVDGDILDVVNVMAGYGYLQAPMYRFDSGLINNAIQSEPIFQGENVIALASYIHSGSLYAIPASFLVDFIKRSKFDERSRVASVFFSAKLSINPFERLQLKIPQNIHHGILVTEIEENSPFKGVLLPGDLITAIDNQKINYKGEIRHPVWDYISVSYPLKRKMLGENLSIDFYRMGVKKSVSRKMDEPYDPQKFVVPPYFENPTDHHIIVGGFVFQEVSKEYLQVWGNSWQKSGPVDLVKEVNSVKEKVLLEGKKKMIIISHVLPLDVNKGFHGMKNYILENANGESVENIKHLEEILRGKPVVKNDQKFMTFKFKYEGLRAVLKYKEVENSRKTMKKNFALPDKAKVF